MNYVARECHHRMVHPYHDVESFTRWEMCICVFAGRPYFCLWGEDEVDVLVSVGGRWRVFLWSCAVYMQMVTASLLSFQHRARPLALVQYTGRSIGRPVGVPVVQVSRVKNIAMVDYGLGFAAQRMLTHS